METSISIVPARRREDYRLLSAVGRPPPSSISLVVLNDAPLAVQFEAVRHNELLSAADDFSSGAVVSKVLRTYWDFEPYLERQRKAYKKRRLNQANGSS